MINEKIYNLIKNAYNDVQFYHELYSGYEDVIEEIKTDINAIKKLPTTSKVDILKNAEQMISFKADSNKLLWEHTSGTTGHPLSVAKTLSERNKAALPMWKWRKKYFHILPSDKYIYFTTIPNNKIYDYVNNVVLLSEVHLNDSVLRKHCSIIEESEAKWIAVTPSVLTVLMNYMKENNVQPFSNIKYIEVTGEFITAEEKEIISKFFKCPVKDQYGTREVWGIAKECNCSKLHVIEDNVFLEILEGQGILVTSLQFTSMPIIRYFVDDLIEDDGVCDCGSNFKAIKICRSRALQFLKVGKEKIISPIFLRISINNMQDNNGIHVKQFQYSQDDINSVTCYLVLKDPENYEISEIKKCLTNEINKLYLLPDYFNVDIKIVSTLNEKIRRGKLNYFVCNV